MFDSLKKIGELKRNSSDNPSSSLPIKRSKTKSKEMYLVIFDNDKKDVRFEKKEITQNSFDEWKFIGNASANKPMDMVTTTELKYVIGFDKDGKLTPKNKRIINSAQSIPKVGDLLKKVVQWYDPSKWKEEKIEEWKKEGYFDGGLYSIVVVEGGKRHELAKFDEYTNYLLGSSHEVNSGVKCQVCGNEEALPNPDYPGGTILKMYITDKKGFTSGITDSDEFRLKTHAVCNDCKNLMQLGESFVSNDLKARVGKLSVFIVPNLSPDSPAIILDRIKVDGSGWIVSINDVEKAEEEIMDEAEAKDYVYSVSMIWGDKQQSKFMVYKVNYDVTMPRLYEVKRTSKKVEEKLHIKELIGAQKLTDKNLDVRSLYALSPVKETTRGVIATPFLDVFSALMEGYSLNRRYIFSNFLQELKCIRTNTCQNAFSRIPFESAVTLSTGFIMMFKILNVMESSKLELDAKEYVDKLGLSKGLKGVFLLGAVTASVGLAQYNKGDKKKAILDRIDFEGMDESDVKVYANRLAESLRDYGILKYNEATLAEALSLINEDRGSLSSPQENVFWLLSGYSWKTLNFIKQGKIKEEETENE
jgi:CRISPR-associated protein Csh1